MHLQCNNKNIDDKEYRQRIMITANSVANTAREGRRWFHCETQLDIVDIKIKKDTILLNYVT